MYQNLQIGNDCPVAFITVNKQRVKQFNTVVYLKDQTEFEIELYNPTTSKYLAEISLNGKRISAAGIVIKPGQRIFLERFIDDNHKFKFETYEVENNTSTASAIANNGDVTVSFYREYVPIATNIPITWSTGYTYNSLANTTGRSNVVNFGNTTNTVTYTAPFDGTVTCNFASNDTLNAKSETNTTSTGTIEKGEISEQTFSHSNAVFNYYVSHVSNWKILPFELKPLEAKDLVKHCTNCGTKLKNSSWKFCPSCGATVNETIDLKSLSKAELIKIIQNKG